MDAFVIRNNQEVLHIYYFGKAGFLTDIVMHHIQNIN